VEAERRQRRAQFVRHLACQCALALERGVVAADQRIDRVRNGLELLVRRAPHTRVAVDVERMDFLAEIHQGTQPLPYGKRQHQRDHRKEPQSRRCDLCGNVVREFVLFGEAEHDHDPHIARTRPASVRTPLAGRLPQ
jgi:hypothetical protein